MVISLKVVIHNVNIKQWFIFSKLQIISTIKIQNCLTLI